MDIKEKLELNKLIRKYEGINDFVLSLKKTLSSKYCKKVEFEGREYKVLSDRQYEAAKGTFNF